jgi:hypothetical protein
MPTSFNVRPVGAAPAFTADDLMKKADEPEVKPSGWVEPLPLRPPPGVALADKIVDAQDKKDRLERIIAEMVAERRKLK